MITIVGLGVGENDLTQEGKAAVLSGGRVILKTSVPVSSKSVLALNVPYRTLDDIYEKSKNFSTLNKNLAAAVRQEAKEGDVVYCVDGAAMEDNSVHLLLKQKNVAVINGVSKASAIAAKVKLASCSYCAFSAYDFSSYRRRTLPLIVYDIDNAFVAGDVKLALADLIGEETPVRFLSGGQVKTIPLYELDRQDQYDYTCALVAEEQPLLSRKTFDLVDLHDVIARLRQPDGCPWDKVQTAESIKMSPVEEAYELLDAVNQKDDGKILEETGDMVLQSVFYAVLKEEEGAFTLSDVLSAECEKMITRHTHIFGQDTASDEAEALSVWDKNKMTEKHQTTYAAAVDDVPGVFPALLQAQKVAKREGRGGLSFTKEERAEEIKASLSSLLALLEGEGESETAAKKRRAGELLFAIADLCRLTGVNAEEALLDEIARSRLTYRAFEELVRADGKSPDSLTREEAAYYFGKARSCT